MLFDHLAVDGEAYSLTFAASSPNMRVDICTSCNPYGSIM